MAMTGTKEQRLVTLMAIMCLKVALVSAGCLENVGASRNNLRAIQDKAIKREVDSWCHCVAVPRNNLRKQHDYLDICFHPDFYTEAKRVVNCTSTEDFKILVNSDDFCERFQITTTMATTRNTTSLAPTTTLPTSTPTTRSSTTNTHYNVNFTEDLFLRLFLFSILVVAVTILTIYLVRFCVRVHRNISRFDPVFETN